MNNDEIIRIWLYKVTQEIRDPSCKVSATNQPADRLVCGDFKYYRVNGNSAFDATRREADEWATLHSTKVQTIVGYPAWMHDLGYRV